jgi:hypothetical protein
MPRQDGKPADMSSECDPRMRPQECDPLMSCMTAL